MFSLLRGILHSNSNLPSIWRYRTWFTLDRKGLKKKNKQLITIAVRNWSGVKSIIFASELSYKYII